MVKSWETGDFKGIYLAPVAWGLGEDVFGEED